LSSQSVSHKNARDILTINSNDSIDTTGEFVRLYLGNDDGANQEFRKTRLGLKRKHLFSDAFTLQLGGINTRKAHSRNYFDPIPN